MLINEQCDLYRVILEYKFRDYKGLEIADVQKIRLILPRATSNFRLIGQPQRAIDLAEKYIGKYEKRVWSPALFTSVAVAHCDLENLETARKCANIAMSLSAGKSSPELIGVYARLKMLEK